MSNEGLTERDYKILTAGFLPEEIGKNGKYDYIKRSAIHRRLRLVDRNWSNDVDTYVQVIGDTVTVWGSLTLKGVTRRNSVSKNLIAYASKENGGEHISEAEYARELANTIKKATSALIFRCAEAFEIGLYMKEKRDPHTLISVLNEGKPEPSPSGPLPSNVTTLPAATPPVTEPPPASEPPPDPPPHWALNGDGDKFRKRAKDLDLIWNDDIKMNLEPGKVLERLTDTTLSFQQAYRKLDEIKTAKVAAELEAQRKAQRKAQPPSQKGDEPISVQGDDLQLGDLVYGLGGNHPGRLVYKLGEADDGAFTSWAVWKNTQFTDTVSAMLFEHRLRFKVTRTAEPLSLPDKILSQIESLKAEHASLTEGSITTL